MQAVMAGATGLIGASVMQELLAEPGCTQVTSIGRRSQHPQVKKWVERIGPMDAVEKLCEGVQADVAFCCLGTTLRKAGSQEAFAAVDRDLPLRLAHALKKQGVQAFHVVSSLGADARSRNFYLRTKGELEDALRAVGFASLVIYRPSLLLGERQESRPLERLSIMAYKRLEAFYPRFLASWQPIAAKTVAQVMVMEALAHPQGVHVLENREIHARARQR